MTTGLLLIIVAAFCFGIPQKLTRFIFYVYKGIIFKMTFHYVEYSYFGNKFTTWQEGPLNDLLGSGLINEVTERGGKILYHHSGCKEQVLDVMRQRHDLKASFK